jgi:hypothetical protein
LDLVIELVSNISLEELKIENHEISGRELELLQIIKKGDSINEKDLVNYFFPGIKNGDISLWKLKQNLIDKLLSFVLLIGLDNSSPGIQKAYSLSYKEFAAFQILRGQGKRKVAIQIAQKTLKRAIKYQFTELVLSIASSLQVHYGAIIGDKAKMNYYLGLVEEYTDIYMAEQKAQKYYSLILSNFVTSKPSTKVSKLAKQYVAELQPLLQRFDSYRLHLLSYNIMISIHQVNNEFEKIIEVCHLALEFFENLSYPTPRSTFFSFQYKTIPAYIQVRKFSKASEAIKNSIELVEAGSYNSMIVLRYQIIQHFYKGSFLEAYQLVQSTKKGVSKFDYLKELWAIYEAYAYLLSGVEEEKRFRLGKFLNEVPTYSKDKRGMNINILVIQILFLMKRRKYSRIIDKMEALQSYTYRHLRKGDTYRSNCFLWMIIQLPKSNFNRVAVERKTKELFGKLQSTKPNIVGQDPDLEIVPYEQLWGYILINLN